MTNLVTELRKLDWLRDEYRETGELIFKAADEIERRDRAIKWLKENWSATAPDDGDYSNVPVDLRDLILPSKK